MGCNLFISLIDEINTNDLPVPTTIRGELTPEPIPSSWWDPGWLYRKQISISNAMS
ncbi:MAG: hypothetical protein JXB88_16860 [Spirochaetales bacterium]|nr:hypothetical protein [Spirochaetales bacterium]